MNTELKENTSYLICDNNESCPNVREIFVHRVTNTCYDIQTIGSNVTARTGPNWSLKDTFNKHYRILEELSKSSVKNNSSKCDTCKHFNTSVNDTVYHWSCAKGHLQNCHGWMINKPIIETCNDYILNDFNKRT
jgi:hypothetical protein